MTQTGLTQAGMDLKLEIHMYGVGGIMNNSFIEIKNTNLQILTTIYLLRMAF